MTDRVGLRLLVILAAALFLGTAAVRADEFTIGYLQLKEDARYAKTRAWARYLTEPLGRPVSGARVAIDEVKFHGAAAGVTFALKRVKGKGVGHLVRRIGTLEEKGVRFFVTDLPAAVLEEVAAKTAGRDILLLNATARADRLRGAACAPHVAHVIPSHRMMTDALAQFLAFKKWRDVLVLRGPGEEDREIGAAFAASARRFGLSIVDTRDFVLGNDPRQRSQNNVVLLTGGVSHDAVFVADTDGEFARAVPYGTVLARPVFGSAGMAAAAWHWAWERHGAPQLEKRFRKRAKREMRDYDWGAWVAVKAIAQAVQRTRSSGFDEVRQFLMGPDLNLDAFKGAPSSFRGWNNQLRQPILLVTQNWVVARAPMQGFEHRLNHLDTLGPDEAESDCRF